MNKFTPKTHQLGFSMIEVLVTLIIILVGLLGIAALQAKAQTLELESYQRAQALILMSDIVDRININRATVACFAVSTGDTVGTYLGVGSSITPTTCTASTSTYNNQAIAAITSIDNLLKGAAETSAGGNSVGSMIGARGCISYDAATEIGGVSGSGLYTVAVSWQGMTPLNTPAVSCADSTYDTDDVMRRTVSSAIRIADLY